MTPIRAHRKTRIASRPPDGYETELGSLAALDGETLATVLHASGVAWPLLARLKSRPPGSVAHDHGARSL